MIPPPYFPITLPKIYRSGVVRVQTFAFRSCPGHLALARIHFGYQNAVTLFPFRDADFFENKERVFVNIVPNCLPQGSDLTQNCSQVIWPHSSAQVLVILAGKIWRILHPILTVCSGQSNACIQNQDFRSTLATVLPLKYLF